ncbi:MAG: UPF0182 family protein [Eubacterium sp.]
MKKGKKTLIGIIVTIVVILGFLLSLNHFYVDYLWFSEMGYIDIFFKEMVTKLQIGAPVFIVFLVAIFIYLKFLSKLSESYLGIVNGKKSKKEQMIVIIIAVIVSLLLTLFISNNLWNEILQFINGTSFGTTDPLFNIDLSFYFFKLPLLKKLYSVVMTCFFAIVILTFLYTAFVLYREKDFRIQTAENIDDFKEGAKSIFRTFLELASKQIGAFLSVFFLLMTFGAFMQRYEMLYGGTGMVYGAGASDITIGMNFIYIKIVCYLIAAIVSVFAGFKKKFKLMAIMPISIIAVVLVGGIVQTAYEYLSVVPNQYTKEMPYIEKNITSTQKAYGLDKVEIKDFSPTQEITATDIKENKSTIENIPINDQKPTKDMYNSLQGIRNYYKFYDVDVDRYFIDGTYTQVFLGTREMDNSALPEDAKTWVNQHSKYTHGFGVAMSPVNKTNSVGQPELIVKDIPPQTSTKSLEIVQPRVYFGEGEYKYAITNGSNPEFDYPEGDNNKEIFYDGTGGIRLSWFNRIAFALYYGSPEMILTSELTTDSKILINRNVMDRVSKIAPFLEYDNKPYMALADGKQYWIVDGFTTSSKYPYSQPYDVTTGKNYIKNPVKIVVDAYNGDVTFYKVDDEPILETYNKIFPGLVKDISEMPKGLKDHIRYSKTLFDVQSDVYKTYHMSNPQVFYNREDQWETAKQFFGQSKEEVPIESSYIIMKLPDRDTEFILTTTFTPRNKDNMIAWMGGVSDGDEYGKLLLYQFPKQQLVYGPMQIEQRIDQNTVISPQLTLLGQQGSAVLRGNLMTIPIENAIIYVEPIYIQASAGANNLPEVKKVIVCYQNEIVMADSLNQALGEIFNYDAGAAPKASNTAVTTAGGTGAGAADLSIRANQIFQEAQNAQKSGDWAGYGNKLNELQTVLNELQQITGAAKPQ